MPLVSLPKTYCKDSGDPAFTAGDITATSGPNGDIDWLNCGVTGNGWTPQQVTVDDLVVVDLADALQDPNSPFKACEQYLDLFQQYGGQYGCEFSSSLL